MIGSPTFEDFMQAYLPNNQAGAANQLHPAQMGGQNMPQGIAPQSGMPAPGAPPSQPYYPQPVQIGGQNPGQSGFGGGMNGGQQAIGDIPAGGYQGLPTYSNTPPGQATGQIGPHNQGGMNMQPGQSNTANQMAQWIAMLQAMRGGAGAPMQPQGISAQTGMGQAPQQFGGPGAINSFPPMQQPQSLANLIQGTAPVRQPGAAFGAPMGTPPQG